MAEGGDSKDYNEAPLTLHIKNLPSGASVDETFEMYLENVTGEDDINIEYSNAFNEALVMFDNLSIDLDDVKNRIRQKPLLGAVLQVEDALPDNRVWVTNLKPGIGKETLELYFEQPKLNPSEGTVEVEYDDSSHAAIVTYSDASAVKIILSTDPSKMQMLGPNVVIKHCKFFDSLDALASDADSVGIEEPCMLDKHEGDHANEEHEDETAETTASADKVDTRPENRGRGRGRGNRRDGRRGGRRGGRQGRGGFGPEGQILYQRQGSASSQHSEPPLYGERPMGHDQGWTSRGNRRPGRGRGTTGDVGRPGYSRGRRPQSASREENNYSADQEVGASIVGGLPMGSPASWRGERPHYPPQRGRWGDGGQNRGQVRGGMYQRAGSVPSLLDQPLTLPTGSFDTSGSICKEIEVKNEVGIEKCQLLTTMIRNVKSHGCEARVDMRRHCVVLKGPSVAVTAAAETVYSQMLDMHSIELEFPARFAQLLATPRGHGWIVQFFKTAQLRAIYYANEKGTPSIVASDEYAANSAKVLLMRRIKSLEIPYAKWQKTYLQSEVWNNFVDSAEKTWLLLIEVTLSYVIRVTGVEDDVNGATEMIRSQLAELEKPIKGKPGSISKPEQDSGPDELPGKQLPRQFPAALDPVEVSKICPICSNEFPESSIADHVNLCSSSKVCPICSKIFSSATPVSLFYMHVNEHFEDSDLV